MVLELTNQNLISFFYFLFSTFDPYVFELNLFIIC